MEIESKNMTKNIIRLTESDLHKIVKESVQKILTEMDWKTYANAAKKRLQQYQNEKDPAKKRELWDSYQELAQYATQRFDDDFVGNMKYDTMGDKLRGKTSPKFEMGIYATDSPYGKLKGYNKGGNEMFSTGKGQYHQSFNGNMSPGQFFKNKEVADKYINANDELWDYHNGAYDYDSIKDGGEGKWHKKK